MAPERAPYLASAAILYNSRGRSTQPVREASAGPGQNPWRPGPKARRRHQPSPAKAGVNLREYRKAPPRSRSRPRHRRLYRESLVLPREELDTTYTARHTGPSVSGPFPWWLWPLYRRHTDRSLLPFSRPDGLPSPFPPEGKAPHGCLPDPASGIR